MKFYVVILVVVGGALAVPVEDHPLQEFIEGNRRFTADVYRELARTEKSNFILSPFSAESILALTLEGAKGPTAQELITALSFPSSLQKLEKAFRQYLPKLKKSNDENNKLQSANKIFIAEGLKFEPNFNRVAAEIFDSGVENVNFKNSELAANTINQWVEQRTNKRIQNLISSDSLDESTAMVLVNALYFKGRWASEFEKYLTDKKPFYKSQNVSKEVDMMQQVGEYNYYEDVQLGAKFLEIPYEANNISMVIALPNDVEGLPRLEQNIEKVVQPKPFIKTRVDVQLPKFKIETKIDFIPILKTLGVDKLFSAGAADLSGLSSNNKNLYVSQVVQKAFISVDEAGTEAAAATAVHAVPLSGMEFPEKAQIFYANHPFLYFIKGHGAVLFAGRYVSSF